MRIKFRCHTCGIEPEIEVPDRARGLDIALWMKEIVASRIKEAHLAISPQCASQTVDLMIAVDEDKDIGAAGTENAQKPYPTFEKIRGGGRR